MAISRFILSRLLQMLVVLVGTVTVLFVVLYFFVPGDAAQTILGHRATPELLQNLRQELGLDKPVWTQYGIYMWRLAHLDLGTSYELNRSVPASSFPIFRLQPTWPRPRSFWNWPLASAGVCCSRQGALPGWKLRRLR